MIDLKELIKSGVHFGHQTWRWNPRMEPYIWGEKDGVHLIDVSRTAQQMELAAKFLEEIAASGKSVLWVGTKKAAAAVLPEVTSNTQAPIVVHRWIGGTLTNWIQIKKSITKKLYLEDIFSKADQSHYTKREMMLFQKLIDRLNKNIGGIQKLHWPIGALVVVDVKKEHIAIKEAAAAGIPVVALVDTNGNPSGIDYVIPCNDDAPKAIRLVLDYLVQAVARGQATRASLPVDQQATADDGLSVEKILEHALGAEEGEAQRPGKGTSRRPAAGRGNTGGRRSGGHGRPAPRR